MTTQSVEIDGLPTGLTPTAKLFDVDAPDTEVTGNTFVITEGANAKGRYVLTITRATVLPAGDYTLRLFLGAVPLAVANRRFAGTDGEVAIETPQAVELDSATSAQITTIAEVLGAAMRGDRSHSEALDLILAATVGKSSQPSGTTERFKFLDDADAFTTTFDDDGNRAAVSLS